MSTKKQVQLLRAGRWVSLKALATVVVAFFLHDPSLAGDVRNGAFTADASSVDMNGIEPSYCSSIDGVDYSARQYFRGPDEVASILGLAIKERTASGVCCTAAKVLTAGACADPVPTVASCAAQGLVLVGGKCAVFVPDQCPRNEDWFAGRFVNTGEIRPPMIFAPTYNQLWLGASTTGAGSTRDHNFERPPFNSNGYTHWESTFNFKVSNLADVGGFTLISTSVDDQLMIEVNGRAAAALPAGFWMSMGGAHAFPAGETGVELSNMGGYVAFQYTTGNGGGGGVALLRSYERDRWSWGIDESFMSHPFIGVPTFEKFAYAPYRRFVYGGYREEDNGWQITMLRQFPPLDTEGTWHESHSIDLKPYLVQGNNKIRFTRMVNGGTYSKAVIRASAKSGVTCN